ncbi:MAG TPA: hypothetical protein PK733_15905 [Clostridiales bacterium]|nr:hypothetical protein [Clostridiales bacterium]
MDTKKEKIIKLLDQFKEAIIEDKYSIYKYYIADLFDELAQLKSDQSEAIRNRDK